MTFDLLTFEIERFEFRFRFFFASKVEHHHTQIFIVSGTQGETIHFGLRDFAVARTSHISVLTHSSQHMTTRNSPPDPAARHTTRASMHTARATQSQRRPAVARRMADVLRGDAPPRSARVRRKAFRRCISLGLALGGWGSGEATGLGVPRHHDAASTQTNKGLRCGPRRWA